MTCEVFYLSNIDPPNLFEVGKTERMVGEERCRNDITVERIDMTHIYVTQKSIVKEEDLGYIVNTRTAITMTSCKLLNFVKRKCMAKTKALRAFRYLRKT